ncbi:MAG: ribosome biogenesis protein [Thaumarchaeota archaeon]|nr:ribosome biogenesis protein [Nitrososphaerota archaeon]
MVLAETAVETLPQELWRNRRIAAQVSEKKLTPEEILLDRSYHHKAMLRLKGGERRGRPDIAHFSMLEAVSSPLYLRGLLKVYVHTCRDKVIELSDKVRLPKTYARFEGLIVQLFSDRKVPELGPPLMQLSEKKFPELVEELRPSKVMGLSRLGEKSNFRDVTSLLSLEERPMLVVGGFPKGPFSNAVRDAMDEVYSMCEMSLEAHVVVARVLYEYEQRIGLQY